MVDGFALLFAIVGAAFFDSLVGVSPGFKPRPRSLAGLTVAILGGVALFGALLAVTGASLVSSVIVVITAASLSLVSSIKRSVLGEPIVFSDFALVGALFQHPQFYIGALKRWQVALLATGAVVLIGLVLTFSTTEFLSRLAGALLCSGAVVGLRIVLSSPYWDAMSDKPDLNRDVDQHGLVATTLVYWFRWRRLDDPPLCDAPLIATQSNPLVVIVQCESFADPIDLVGVRAPVLPGLEAARSNALMWGRLNVPGFGAYTMRTEYGVLFGRSDDQLGLRRFDPFLTAPGEASRALPSRLKPEDWTSIFVHPHDLRFYGRDRLMPAARFSQIIGETEFPRPGAGQGRYVTDESVCDKIMEIAVRERGATLVYAVTIENHGPWPSGGQNTKEQKGEEYLRLLQRSDASLLRLFDQLPKLGRPVVLCFFGDHRPSIPGVSEPFSERHTPYVVVGFGPDGAPLERNALASDLTPSQLHHAILELIGSWGREGEKQAITKNARQKSVDPA